MPNQIILYQQTQAAALTKLDRCLQELELQGQKRIQPIEQVMATFDLNTLKSIVYDVEDALTRYHQAQKELNRITA